MTKTDKQILQEFREQFGHMKPEWFNPCEQFILAATAKTLKEHDEKLVEEMEKEKKVSFSEVDVSQRIYNQAIDRAIEIVKSDE